ncbi:MAG TPA: hypothetical protein VJ508_14385, partial [Saprospiraceae bacterium]|nr:hypothetical protein [Saprospiraceae bacterium]
RTVECKEDIKEEQPQAVAACNLGAVYFDGPYLESGKDNCPNAVYTITYTVEDTCGRSASCIQRWRLTGDDLVVKCPNDTIVRSKDDIVPSAVFATTSCDVDAQVENDPPVLISGSDGKPGAVYQITYRIKDDCDQHETCVQKFTLLGLTDDCRQLCDCYKEIKNVPIELVRTDNDRFNRDLAALIKKYGCKKLKSWAQSGVAELWNAWATSEILGNESGIAADIAGRGNIGEVLKNLANITKAIEILEEAINGDPKKTMEIIAEWGLTDGVTYLTGSGTPALVFTSIKSLGEFAGYLNKESLLINIKTLSGYADQDPCLFDPDHFLLEYAKIRELKP